MNRGDLVRFAGALRRAKVAMDVKEFPQDRVELYFDKLKAHEIADIERAIEHLIETMTVKRMPFIGEIRDAAFKTRSVPTADARPFDPANPVHCWKCKDSGWREFWCGGKTRDGRLQPPPTRSAIQGDEVELCLRPFEHDGHTYVKQCVCAPTNPRLKELRSRSAV